MRIMHVEMMKNPMSSDGAAAARALQPTVVVTYLKRSVIRHRRLLRAAWLVGLLALAACQPDANGGGGGDGY